MSKLLLMKGLQRTYPLNSDNILRGSNVYIDIDDNLSIGKNIHDGLKNSPPEKLLLFDGESDEKLTVGELLQRGINLSAGMKEEGVNEGDVVVIIAENTISANIVALATWFLGAVMFPIDPSHKTYEFQHLFKIVTPTMVFCEDEVLNEVQDALTKLQKLDIPVYILQNNENGEVPSFEYLMRETFTEDFVVPSVTNNRESLAAIVCSSGTTGLPKGVGLSHYSLIYSGRNCDAVVTGTSFIQTSYFYWVSGVLFFVYANSMAFPRVLLRTADPVKVLRAIDQFRPNSAMFSPSLLMSCLSNPNVGAFDLTSIKMIFVGGSPLTQAVVDKSKDVLPNSVIIQGYGATELGIICTTNPAMDVLSAGKIKQNCALKFKDILTGKALPAGEEGEIVAKSPSMMLYYVGNEEATKNALDEDGWYKTGDLGKVTKSGAIYITGRIKELLKVDNHQIAPAEIEEIISQVAGVLDAVVVGIPIEENSLPMALVVRAEDSTVSAEDIILAVKENLSEFKQLRAGVFFLDSLPRTSTGKLKRIPIQAMAEQLFRNNGNVIIE